MSTIERLKAQAARQKTITERPERIEVTQRSRPVAVSEHVKPKGASR